MRDSLRELCKSKHKVFIIDAAGVFSGFPTQFTGLFITSPKVLDEVKDAKSKQTLEFLLSSRKLHVCEVKPEFLRRAKEVAKELGELRELSVTDLEVLALFIEFKEYGCEVTVVTDDYSIQNIVKYLGGKFIPIKTKGVTHVITYAYLCTKCGYRGEPLKGNICPICGSKMKKVRARR